MATILHFGTPEEIRVASVIAAGQVRPVWFERLSQSACDRIFIREINSTWTHRDGATRILSYSVSDGNQSYVLSFNPTELTWLLQPTEESTF